jgi:hypothetical protein
MKKENSVHQNSEKENNFIKLLPFIITSIGIIIGAWQFLHQIKNSQKEEFLNRIWSERYESYSDITNRLVSLTGFYNDGDLLRKKIDTCRNLINGKIRLIFSKKASNRKIINEFISKLNNCDKFETTFDPTRDLSQYKLKNYDDTIRILSLLELDFYTKEFTDFLNKSLVYIDEIDGELDIKNENTDKTIEKK